MTRVNLTKRIMTFFFDRRKKESYLSQKNSMTDESIRFRMFFVLCICMCFTLEIYRFFLFILFFSNNLFLFNETRSKFELCIVNVNHNVVGLPTTSGFVLTLTRFVTRTYF